jgi:hypothetical protein
MGDRITPVQRSCLKAMTKGEDKDGWSRISHLMYPYVTSYLTEDLATIEPYSASFRGKTTDAGRKAIGLPPREIQCPLFED